MPIPVIQRINSLKGLPVFPAYTAPNHLPNFRKHNLIYGFNGGGKTTLARVFASLGTGILHSELPQGGTFSVTLSDGSRVEQDNADDTLAQRILVFNTDFITENFRWKQGEANPIFYLGQEQKELSTSLEATTAKAERMNGRLQRVSTIYNAYLQTFSQHKRDQARLIANELGLGRQYVSTQLDADYANYTYSKEHLLDDASMKVQRDILKQDEPMPKLTRLSNPTLAISDLISNVRKVLKTTLGSISIESLREHDKMLPWVKIGMEYHKVHDLDSCLLCGNPLTEVRLRTLESAIDERYDQLIEDIGAAKTSAETLRNALSEVKAGLLSKHDVAKAQQADFVIARSRLQSAIDEGKGYADRAVSLLAKKQETPNAQVVPDDLPDVSRAEQWINDLVNRVDSFNVMIDEHNKSHDDFQTVCNYAKDKIKKHYLAEGHDEYLKLEADVSKAKRVHETLKVRSESLKTDIDDLKQKMREHRVAANHVNRMIHNYLGHKELKIAPREEGYEIRRLDKATKSPPSEGEKTAIAICYFLVLLEAEGRKREDLIVVLDDPISSLDTQALNYACSIIRSLENVGQLIVLTHNVNVMNEIKKWLKKRTEKAMLDAGKNEDDATATLLFLDTTQPNGSGTRTSAIIEMPRHLREYESEYQYLFHLLLRFLEDQEDQTNYFFVMPNALRKIFEVFLAFKKPGSEGLSDKVDQLIKQNELDGIDECRVRALERLAHVESHGDSLEDLTTLPSMTIEETQAAAESLLKVMEKLDPTHLKRMRRICRL